MPPIPIYSNAPINPNTAAATADGVTPQTASNLNDQQGQQQHPPPTRTIPASVPATTTQSAGSLPPAPQPGAVPIPPPPTTSAAAAAGGGPPAPQPGQAPSAATATATHAAYLPPQFAIPAPQANAAPTASTTAAPTFGTHPGGPTTINLGPAPAGASPAEMGGTHATREQRRSLEHPPGYVQNPYAADGTAEQRARLEAAAQAQQEEGGLWGSMRAAAAKVGEGLKKGEEEAWKLVGGSGGKGGPLGG